MATASTLHDVVWNRLRAIADIDAYDGEMPASLPTEQDGRVRSYAVLYGSAGTLFATALTGDQLSLTGYCQVTCVGGDHARTLECVDAVRAGLLGSVTVDGKTRVIRALEEDPGPVRTNEAVWPPRHYVPLEFQLFAP